MISKISQRLDFHAEFHNLFDFYCFICMSLTTPHDISKTLFFEASSNLFSFLFNFVFLVFFVMSQNVLFNESSREP